MKSLLFLFLISSFTSFGQPDICKNIVRETKEIEGSVTYHSPLLGKATILGISKTIEDTLSSYSIYIGLVNNMAISSSYGISIQFEDGSVYKDEHAPITCKMIDADKFNISGSIPVNESDMESVSGSRIVTVTCGGLSHRVEASDADKLLLYIKCLSDR